MDFSIDISRETEEVEALMYEAPAFESLLPDFDLIREAREVALVEFVEVTLQLAGTMTAVAENGSRLAIARAAQSITMARWFTSRVTDDSTSERLRLDANRTEIQLLKVAARTATTAGAG